MYVQSHYANSPLNIRETDTWQILGWIAVGFRLHTRFVVVREPGWDDVFVILAAVFNLVSMIAFLECTAPKVTHKLSTY